MVPKWVRVHPRPCLGTNLKCEFGCGVAWGFSLLAVLTSIWQVCSHKRHGTINPFQTWLRITPVLTSCYIAADSPLTKPDSPKVAAKYKANMIQTRSSYPVPNRQETGWEQHHHPGPPLSVLRHFIGRGCQWHYNVHKQSLFWDVLLQ
jgi:hypothetical protein